MNQYDDRQPRLPIGNELDDLIREALQEAVGDAEPSPLVWARIRAEIETGRVPAWITWWRRLQIAMAHTLPRVLPRAIIVALFILLGGSSLRGYGWLGNALLTSNPGLTASHQRQIAIAERRFYDQYRTEYCVVPVDAPPKGSRREPHVPAPPTGPRHLAVEAMNPS